jgi:hypothetical protein
LVETSRESKITISWNPQVKSDRTVSNNKPGPIIRDNGNGTYLLKGITISGDQERSRHAIKIYRLYNKNTAYMAYINKSIPVIIGATGTISKLFRKYLSNIPGKQDIKEPQKTAILGTAHASSSYRVHQAVVRRYPHISI